MEQEVFKSIEGYENLYEVSNYGKVKSLAKKWNHRGNGYREKAETFLSPGNSSGYPRVILSDGVKQKTYSVHVLVAKAFCENPNNYPIVNHKNSIRNDNYYDNLEWTTYKGNAQHAFLNGNRKGKKGITHHNAKYTERDIRIIRKLYNDGKYTQLEIAKMFEDVESNISRIISRERWAHIL